MKEEKMDDKGSVKIKVPGLNVLRKNPWILATIVLAIVLIVSLIYGALGSGGSVSANVASDNLLKYIDSLGRGSATLVSSVKDNGMYKVTVKYNGQDIPVYVSMDGNYLIADRIPLTAKVQTVVTGNAVQEAPKEVPKSDKPVADFYVFSYCPYGTQMEKALVPVYNLLKSKVDINLVFIGAMHGEYEHVESLRQICIQKNYGKDKLFAYLDKFLVNAQVGTCNGKDICVNPLIEAIFTQIGVDNDKINKCMATDAEAIYQADGQKAQSLGIGGSPTVTINGAQISVGRSPALVQEAICSGFNNQPSECSKALSSASASPGFGSTASSGSTASCG